MRSFLLATLLTGCAATLQQQTPTTRTYVDRAMKDPIAGGSAGEYYILISEATCVETTTYPKPQPYTPPLAPVVTSSCKDTARLLRCQETGTGPANYVTTCHTTLTSDQAFAVATSDYRAGAKSGSTSSVPQPRLAGELRCSDVLSLVKKGTTEEQLLKAVDDADIYNDEADCIASAGIPGAVQKAVAAKAKPRP